MHGDIKHIYILMLKPDSFTRDTKRYLAKLILTSYIERLERWLIKKCMKV